MGWQDQSEPVAGDTPVSVGAENWRAGSEPVGQDAKPVEAELSRNISKNWTPDQAKPAKGWGDAFAAGFDMSVTGLSRHAPEHVLPQDASLMQKVLSGAGMMAGDVPATVLGFFGGAAGGAAAGAAVPVAGETGAAEAIGGVVGAGFGSAAMPEAMRGVLMDYYEHQEKYGQFPGWQDVFSRSSKVVWNTAKAGVVGAVAGPVAGKAAGIVAPVAGKAAAAGASIGAYAGTASAVGAGLDGKVPDAQDFITNAALGLGFHAAYVTAGGGARFVRTVQNKDGSTTEVEGDKRTIDTVAQRMRDIYRKTGIPPWEARQRMGDNPLHNQDILSEGPDGELTIHHLRADARPEPEPFKLKDTTAPPPAEKTGGGVAQVTPELIAQLEGSEAAAAQHNRANPSNHITADQVVSPAGAIGLHQIMPGTAKQYGFDPERLMDRAYNTKINEAILKDLRHRFPDDPEAQLIGYNAGPGKAMEFIRSGRDYSKLPRETQRYLERAHGLIGDNVRTRLKWSNFEKGGEVGRQLGDGRIVPEPEYVADYLREFGEKAGFNFVVGQPESAPSRGDESPYYAASGGRGNRGAKYVYIPDTPSDLSRRWYGLGPYEILYHEVGHAIDNHLSGGAKFTGTIPAELKPEIEAASRNFRPQLWTTNEWHLSKPDEQMADAIASWLSNPEMRARMPKFSKAYGKKLKPFLEIANSRLPKRGPDGAWTPPDDGAGGGQPPGQPPSGGSVGPPEGPKRIEGPSPFDKLLAARSAAQEAVAEKKTVPFWQKAQDFLKEAEYGAVSEIAPARWLDKKLGTKEDEWGVRDGFQFTYGSVGRAYDMIRHGTFDPRSLERTSKDSIYSAYAEAEKLGGPEGKQEFLDLRVALSTLDRAARGQETTLAPDKAQIIADEFREKYGSALKIVRHVNDAKLDYAVAAGRISKGQADAMKAAEPNWFPMIRESEADKVLGPGSGKRFAARTILHKAEGGTRKFIDPQASEIASFYNVIAESDRNLAKRYLVGKLSKKEQGDLGLTRIATHKIEVFDKDGNLIPEFSEPVALKDNEFGYYEDGKYTVFATDEPMIARMVRGMTQGEQDYALGILRWAAQIKRSGVTDMPDFIVRAMTKDALGSFILNKWGGPPFANTFKGIWTAIAKPDVFQDYVRHGGFGIALAEMDAKYIERDINRLFEETGTWGSIVNAVKHPLQAAQVIAQRTDSFSRLGAYRHMTEQEGTDPLKAGLRAQNYSLNFQEHGAWPIINIMAKITPFFRPGILGFRQFAEAHGPARIAATVTKAAFGIMLPTAILYAINHYQDEHDDIPEAEKFKNLDRWQKDTMFVLPRVYGVRLRLPMPPVLGTIYGGLTNRLLDHFVEHDPRAFKEWRGSILAQFVPAGVPAAILPFVEHWANSSTMTGRPLIPSSLEKVSGYMQYQPYTSEAAKALSRIIGPPGLNLADPSPIMVDNYVRQWMGGAGQAALQALDIAIPHEPKQWDISNLPMLGSFFVRYPSGGTKPIDDFHDEFKTLETARADVKAALATGDQKLIDFTVQNPAAWIQLSGAHQTISDGYALLRKIDASHDMSPTDKRQLSESIYTNMLFTARGALDMLDDFRKQAKE